MIMAECKTCIHEPVCEKAKHVENHHIQGCEYYKNEANVDNTKYGEIIKLLKQLPQLKMNLEIAKMKVSIIEKALKVLTDEESKIINALFTKGEKAEDVAFDLNIERSTFYRKRNIALDKLMIAINGGEIR